MAKHLFRMCLWTVGLMLVGCAAQKPVTPFAPTDLNPKIQSGQYIQNANNLMIILDNSGSMKDIYLGQRKFNMARDIVNRINWTIPDIKLTIALRTFGFDIVTSEDTTLVYGPTPYYAYGFEKAFKGVRSPNGPSPMDLALNAAIEDLSSTTVLGKIAVIVVSDGAEMSVAPLAAAERLKAMFGDQICIYTIQIGNDPAGRILLEKIAKAGDCGFSSQGEQILSSSDVADFVERVLLKKKPVEAAKPVPLPVKAAKMKPAVKKASAPVKESAPEVKNVPLPTGEPLRMTINIQFDTGKADVKPKYSNEIKKVADFMVKYPASSVVIEGHTDNVGKKVYNQKLSQRRAESVRMYLVKKFGIKQTRIKAVGYGMERPIASNKTADGRQMNRRIIAVIETIVIKN